MKELLAHREGKLGWRRFPVYYTLLFLSETAEDMLPAIGEKEDLIHRSKLLGKRKDVFSQRRYMILLRLLQNNHQYRP